MNSTSILEATLQEILQVIKPLREDWETRFRIIEELQFVVQSVESLRGATIEPFGSFVSNLFTRWGDLDISIKLYSGSCILYTGKKQKQSLLGDLLRALRQSSGWYRLQFISHARVPILKIESSIQRISCDISIDNLGGLLKSKFLFWISEIDGRFRDMVLLVKEWAKAHDINNPKVGTFNSYSLSLLVIFHFQITKELTVGPDSQRRIRAIANFFCSLCSLYLLSPKTVKTCVPAILPPLKDIYPRSAVDDLTGVREAAEANIANVSAANIARFKSHKSRPVNKSSLSELFVSFLAKFSDLNLRAQELGICPFTGRWENIHTNMRWLPKTYSLFIEDPFQQPENAARSVSAKQLDRITQVFEMSRSCLISDNNKNSLLAMLTSPRVSQFITRTPIKVPSYNNNNNGGRETNNNPNGHKPASQDHFRIQDARPVHFRPQTQNQFQSGNPQMRRKIQNGAMPADSSAIRQHQFQNWTPQMKSKIQNEDTLANSSARIQNQFQNGKPYMESKIQNGDTSANSSARREKQFQNVRSEGWMDGSTSQRPVQKNPGQGQRMWTPKYEK